MEFPPDEWDTFPAEAFELAACRDPGDLGVELMAQARPNGRLVDHCRLVLGSSKPVDVLFELKDITTIRSPPPWRLSYTTWPREIIIRRNMASTTWFDIKDLVAQRDILVTVVESDDEIDPADFAGVFDGSSSNTVTSTSIMWAVGAGAYGRVQLLLQSLPFCANTLNSKPLFKG